MRALRTILLIVSMVIAGNAVAQTVYTTKTGEKYHKETCQYLKYSKIEVQLIDAKELGYDPCSVCKPPKKISETSSNNSSSINSSNRSSARKATASQCTGRTKSGARCKRRTKNASGRCYQH